MDFNTFDVIILCITFILAIKGFFNGIIKEIAGIVGIGLGIYLGGLFYHSVGNYINSNILKIPNESAINVVGFVAVFILTWIIIIVLGLILSKIIKIAQLGILDRIGGIIFSAGKFFIIVAVIVTLLSKIEAMHKYIEKWSKNSITYPYLIKTGEFLMNIKPDEVQKQINDIKEKINEKIGKDIKQKMEETKEKIANGVSDSLKPAIDKALQNKGE